MVLRDLTAAELELVAGGGYVDQNGDIVVAWQNYWVGHGGGGGGGHGGTDTGYQTNPPPPPPPPTPSSSGLFALHGRTDCQVDLDGFDQAIQMLLAGSPTAKTLIDRAVSEHWSITLDQDLHDDSDTYPNKSLTWDPFGGIEILNNDGTGTGRYQSPMMGLVHEMAHLMYPPDAASYSTGDAWGNVLEKDIIVNWENKIAAELNAKYSPYGWHEEIRQNHLGKEVLMAGTTTQAKNESGSRVDCPASN